MWSIITLLIINVLGLRIYLAKHGEFRTDKYNFFVELIAFVLSWWLLYDASLFFDKYL